MKVRLAEDEAIDGASTDDRTWFEAHPRAAQRLRRCRPGEMGPMWEPPPGSWVVVQMGRDGVPLRRVLKAAELAALIEADRTGDRTGKVAS